MKWIRGPKGEERVCSECGKPMHTGFQREGAPDVCGRCMKSAWQDGDVMVDPSKIKPGEVVGKPPK